MRATTAAFQEMHYTTHVMDDEKSGLKEMLHARIALSFQEVHLMRFSLRDVQAIALVVFLTATVSASPQPCNVSGSSAVDGDVVWRMLGKVTLSVARFFRISPLEDYPTPPKPGLKREDLPTPPKPISNLEDFPTPPRP